MLHELYQLSILTAITYIDIVKPLHTSANLSTKIHTIEAVA